MDLFLTCQCILGFLALLFLLCNLCRHARPAYRKNFGQAKLLPPQPAGAWPVVGHLPLLGGKEIAARTLGRMADDYGPVFMLRLGEHRALVISSHEAVKECFTTWDREFATRPRNAAGKYLGYDHTMIVFATYGLLWRDMRKIAMVELLSSSRLEKLRSIRVAEIGTRMRELYELCANGGHAKVEMRQWFQDTTFNVIVRMVVGRRYIGGAAVDGGEMRLFKKAITEFISLMLAFVPSDAVPWLEWLDLGGYIKAMKRTAKEVDAAVTTWIEEHRQKGRPNPGMAEGDQDFIDVMLSTMEGVDDLSTFDRETAIKATVLDMIFAGTDTSAHTMTWALALLLNHRWVLDKIRQELDRHVGVGRSVEEPDIKNLVYLQAVLKETMRLYPIAPLSAPHEASADCQVGGYHVPAGTRLLTNLWKLHRDPRVWEDPLQFRPERFLAGNTAGIDARGQHFEYLPFSSGRRMCPGVTLALQVMQLTLARLLHGFDLETPHGAPVNMEEGQSLLTMETPFEVLVTPRLPLHLYSM